MPNVLVIAWLTISMIAVILTVRDKHAAKIGCRRTPEATLLWVAFFGGAAAMLVTMKWIRHKTRKPKFMIGLPLMLVFHILVAGGLLVWQSTALFAT